MADLSPLRALTCPNCGAPLEFPKERSTLRCRFCDSVIERSDEAPTDDEIGHALKVEVLGGQVSVSRSGSSGGSRRYVVKMQGGQPLVIEAGDASAPVVPPSVSRPYVSTPAPRRSGLSCVMGIVVTLIGFGLVAAFAGPALLSSLLGRVVGPSSDFLTQVPGLSDALTQVPAATTRYNLSGSALLVPAVSDAPADIIALTTQYPLSGGDSTQHLVALSGGDAKLLWSSDALDKDTYYLPIQADRDLVFTVTGTRLLALRRADGRSAWNVSLPDKVETNLCAGCLSLAAGRLFALTDDGTLQAFEAATGTPLWKYRAVQDSPRGLYLLAGRPAFMDRDADGHGLLRAFDPATGEMQTLQPGCQTDFSQPDYADWTTQLDITPDGASGYLIFGFFRTCIARFDTASLELTWNSQVPEDVRQLDSGQPPVFGTDALYLAAGDQVLRVALADGALQALPVEKDYTFTPLAVAGDVLLAQARRQRGSDRYELWALDPATGEQRWSYNLDQAPPLAGNSSIIDEDKPVWTWHVVDGSLLILRFKAAADDVSHAVSVDTVNLATGVSTGEKDVRLGVETIILSAPDLLGWQKGTLWFVIEGEVLALDTSRNAIVYRWP